MGHERVYVTYLLSNTGLHIVIINAQGTHMNVFRIFKTDMSILHQISSIDIEQKNVVYRFLHRLSATLEPKRMLNVMIHTSS